MRVVVVSPHRDDAAFSLGLAVESWLRKGQRVDVLNCFTQSNYAPFSDVTSLHANDQVSFVSALRRREDVAWSKLLPLGLRWNDLDLMDAPLRLGCSVDEVLSLDIRPGDRALARVTGALRKAVGKAQRTAVSGSEPSSAPSAVGFLIPLAVGNHVDHRIVNAAALEVAQSEASVPLAFYEDLPYIARPQAEDEVQSKVSATGFALQPWFAQTEQPADAIAAAVDRKRRMAQCYDSQIDDETAQHIAAFSARYDGRERIWANDAWLSAVEQPEQGDGVRTFEAQR